jgi:TRAP-type transport system periplasmic protein
LNRAKSLHHPIYTLSEAEEARWHKASQPAYDAWIKEMDSKGLSGKQMVEAAESLVAKYKAAARSK